MKNIQIGAALKTMRKNRGWTIHDVVVQLNDLYNIAVAEKTVYGWESDQAYPRTETLLLLCELYQSDAFTGNLLHIPADKSFPITADERHVIEMYHQIPGSLSATLLMCCIRCQDFLHIHVHQDLYDPRSTGLHQG